MSRRYVSESFSSISRGFRALTHALSALRTARWRSEPATDAQKKFVIARWSNSKLRNPMKSEDLEAKIRNMTKGEAANVITRLKHGAQVCKLNFQVRFSAERGVRTGMRRR
jgi:hypothetical protein